MKELIITYIIIVILQLIYTIYVPVSNFNNVTGENVIKDPVKKKQIEKFIEDKIKILIDKAKNMNYSDWIKYVEKNSLYEYDGMKMYLFVWKYIDKDRMNVVVHPEKRLLGIAWDDFYKDYNERLINIQHTLSSNAIINMYNHSDIGDIDSLEYYWIDPLYQNTKTGNLSVKKKSLFTKFSFKEQNISGIIGMGYNKPDPTTHKMYKRFTYLNKLELAIGSLVTIVLSLVISKLNTVKYTKIKAFIFLILINLYILIFNNTESQVSKIVDENRKIETVNSNILNLSFLSSINLFILSTLYYSNKDLFVETSAFFGMTILLLLLATYKSASQNTVFDLIKITVTNTFLFNYAVILNMIILGSFMFYTFSKSFKKGLIYI